MASHRARVSLPLPLRPLPSANFLPIINKSASLRKVVSEMENIENENAEGHSFESGTMEGLMKAMLQNNGSILGLFDEFSTLIDNIDKGTTGTSEKGRFLSLYSAVDWSKKTKSCGNMSVKDPRLNLISYTQPFYAVNFARNNLQDGFFQRFLITVPAESFVKFEMKEEAMVQSKNVISFSTILQKIYVSCTGKGMELQLNKEAMHHNFTAAINRTYAQCMIIFFFFFYSDRFLSQTHSLQL